MDIQTKARDALNKLEAIYLRSDTVMSLTAPVREALKEAEDADAIKAAKVKALERVISNLQRQLKASHPSEDSSGLETAIDLVESELAAVKDDGKVWDHIVRGGKAIVHARIKRVK